MYKISVGSSQIAKFLVQTKNTWVANYQVQEYQSWNCFSNTEIQKSETIP